MNYLIPTFDCVVFDGSFTELKEDVKYEVHMCENCGIVFSKNNSSFFVLDFSSLDKNILKVNDRKDVYYFIFKQNKNDFFTTKFTFKSSDIFINLSSNLKITVNDVLICEEDVENLNFSHYEIFKDLCLIYFEGDRNFVVVLKERELIVATYYDEFNESENEKIFMTKLNDSLNHGKVFQIKDNKLEEYLVYLDEEDLNLKSEFTPFVFLDCVKAKNFTYANQMLNENLKLKDEKEIKNFFPKFNCFYPINKNRFVLINKNTLAGIYEFNIENDLISNIILLD